VKIATVPFKLAVALALCASLGSVRAQPISEYELKAAFIYNFALFTDWGADPPGVADSRFTVCVYGSTPLSASLAKLEGKTLHNKPVVVRGEAALNRLSRCQIVFIAPSETGRMREIADALGRAAVLTVTDDEGPERKWSALQLSVIENRVAFQVNLAAADRAGLVLSSKLLRLAKVIKRESDD
jgi:hypothetical protein